MASVPETGPDQPRNRPLPRFCPRCRHKEVRRTAIAYECPRTYQGRTITVVIPDLRVLRCANCHELSFDYVAEEQINAAYRAQTSRPDLQTQDGRGGRS